MSCRIVALLSLLVVASGCGGSRAATTAPAPEAAVVAAEPVVAKCALDGLSSSTRALPAAWRNYLPWKTWKRISGEAIAVRFEGIYAKERCIDLQLAFASKLGEQAFAAMAVGDGFRAQSPPRAAETRYLRSQAASSVSMVWSRQDNGAGNVHLCVKWPAADACAQRLLKEIGARITEGEPGRQFGRGQASHVSYTRVFPGPERDPDAVVGLSMSATFWCEENKKRPAGLAAVSCEPLEVEHDGYMSGRGEKEWLDQYDYNLLSGGMLQVYRFADAEERMTEVYLELRPPDPRGDPEPLIDL